MIEGIKGSMGVARSVPAQSQLMVVSASPEQTAGIGRAVAGLAHAGDVVGLIGALGAGKTQFVRGLAVGLGVDEGLVSSPTFVLVQEYSLPGGELRLIHVDAYRVDRAGDLESIGWETDVFSGAVVAVEWADRLGGEMPGDRLEVRMTHVGSGRRGLTFTGHGSWKDRMARLSEALVGVAGDAEPAAQKRCPICGCAVGSEGSSFPFCSERCRLIDLGRWADGRYTISRPIENSDLEEGVD